jgi:hypothetical protein
MHHEFHSMAQSNLSVTDYCKHMKVLADSLHDVGYSVSTLS